MATPKISVYSLPDLKNTTDDALPNYLNSLKFKQSHFLTDVRLALGYSAVLIAAATFYFDYKLGWDKTKDHIFWAVVSYFILNGALTVWIWGIEKGKVFTGELDGTLISIASKVTKHNPVYKLTVRFRDPKTTQPFDWDIFEISSPFTRWFSADGHFVAKPFQQWLASEIAIVGQAGQKHASNGGSIATQETPQDQGPLVKENSEPKSILTSGEVARAMGRSRKQKR